MLMEKGGEKNVPISRINDKQSITATFSIILDNKFLPMQLIYKSKPTKVYRKLTFQRGFR